MLCYQSSVISVGGNTLKRNAPSMLLNSVVFSQRTILLMNALLSLDSRPCSREEESLRHLTPLGDNGDNKTPACFLTQLHNTPNNNGYLPCLILNGQHKPNLGNKGGEYLYMGMSPFNQQFFPPIHNILRIFHSCS
jgi:hypothetical protein